MWYIQAAWKGHEKIVKLLLENSADVNAKTKYNRTALMLAARYGHEKVVKKLLEKSADVNAMVIPILTSKHIRYGG